MNQRYLSNASLKIIAIICMLIDHIGVTLIINHDSLYIFFRIIGRLTFPIFAFLIVEGYYYTRNVYKYIIRLFIFALLSENAFDLAFYHKNLEFTHQNIFFTLALGLIAITLFDRYKQKNQLTSANLSLVIIGFLTIFLKTDYSIIGILMIFCFYLFRNHFKLIVFSISFINIIVVLDYIIPVIANSYNFRVEGIIQIFSLLALFFIYFYNHKKGHQFRYLFYFFYPIHLYVLYFIVSLLFR